MYKYIHFTLQLYTFNYKTMCVTRFCQEKKGKIMEMKILDKMYAIFSESPHRNLPFLRQSEL
jgi:hypothetical protein